MYERHVPAKYKDQAPRGHPQRRRHRSVGLPGGGDVDPVRHGGHGRLAGRGLGTGRGHVTRNFGQGASTWRPGFDDMDVNGVLASMCFPSMAGLQRPHLHRGPRQGGLARHAPGVQRLAHRRVVRCHPALHPARHGPPCGTPTRGRRGAAHREKGCRAISFLEAPHSQGRPSYPPGLLGPDVRGAHTTRTWCSACTSVAPCGLITARGRGTQRPLDRGSPPDHDADRARISSSVRRCASTRSLEVAFSEGGIGWIPFYLDRVDRHFHVQKWTQRLRRESCRPRSSGSTYWPATSATRPASTPGTSSGSTSSPGNATTPTRTRRGRCRRSSPGTSSQRAAVPDDEIHKITWENACRFFDFDPFTTTSARARHRR